jgi:aminoglycoside phosphotransferase (APT) family kinase protein
MINRDTSEIRPGEGFDTERLKQYLQAVLPSGGSEIEVTQFPSGNSNLTYCVRIGDSEFVLRRPPFGNQVRSAHDMWREFSVLSKLSAVYGPAPKPIAHCADDTVIGAEFFLMERRRGLIIRGRAPDFLEASTDLQFAVCESFIRNLADLHALDYRSAGLGDLGRPDGYVQRQVEGWTERYFNSRTHDHFELEAAIDWLGTNIPGTGGAALVHNDYKFDNVMLRQENITEIAAVLDWEMATIGDPLMDLGTALGYWISKEAGRELLSMPFNPRVLMENVTRAELVQMYAEWSGRDVSGMLFYYVFGTIKIAVIAQQIFFRFAKGHTADRRFAEFDRFVKTLGQIAMHAIGRGTI